MTPEIGIRCYRPEDASDLYAAAKESESDVFPWLSWCHPDYSLAEAEEWVSSRARLFEQGREYEFVIVDSEGRFLGGCGLNQINTANRLANLGYWVRTGEVGRGVATCAVSQVVDFAFSQTDLERLEIVCEVKNTASQRVAEKSGAVCEGIMRGRIFLHGEAHDAIMYSILRSDQKAV